MPDNIGRPLRTATPKRSSSSSWRWWSDSIIVSLTGLVGGLCSLVTGEPLASALALFALAIVSGVYAQRARHEFRRGWRQGYETAARVMLERAHGRTTDVQARAAVHGDPTPEPWDEHVPLRVPDGAGR